MLLDVEFRPHYSPTSTYPNSRPRASVIWVIVCVIRVSMAVFVVVTSEISGGVTMWSTAPLSSWTSRRCRMFWEKTSSWNTCRAVISRAVVRINQRDSVSLAQAALLRSGATRLCLIPRCHPAEPRLVHTHAHSTVNEFGYSRGPGLTWFFFISRVFSARGQALHLPQVALQHLSHSTSPVRVVGPALDAPLSTQCQKKVLYSGPLSQAAGADMVVVSPSPFPGGAAAVARLVAIRWPHATQPNPAAVYSQSQFSANNTLRKKRYLPYFYCGRTHEIFLWDTAWKKRHIKDFRYEAHLELYFV